MEAESSPQAPSPDLRGNGGHDDDQRELNSDLPSSSPQQSPPPPAQTVAASGTQQSSQFSMVRSQENRLKRRDSGLGSHQPGDASGGQLQTITKIMEAPIARLNAEAELTVPIQESIDAYDKFQKELTVRFCTLMIEFQAWVNSRPRHERMTELGRLEEKVKSIAQMEEQQGMSSSSSSELLKAAYMRARSWSKYEPVRLDAHSSSVTPTQTHSSASELIFMERTRQRLTQFVRGIRDAMELLTQTGAF